MTLSNDELNKTVRYAYRGLTGEEIGEKLGVTAGAVSARLKLVNLDLQTVRKAKREGKKLKEILPKAAKVDDKDLKWEVAALWQVVTTLTKQVNALENKKWWRF